MNFLSETLSPLIAAASAAIALFSSISQITANSLLKKKAEYWRAEREKATNRHDRALMEGEYRRFMSKVFARDKTSEHLSRSVTLGAAFVSLGPVVVGYLAAMRLLQEFTTPFVIFVLGFTGLCLYPFIKQVLRASVYRFRCQEYYYQRRGVPAFHGEQLSVLLGVSILLFGVSVSGLAFNMGVWAAFLIPLNHSPTVPFGGGTVSVFLAFLASSTPKLTSYYFNGIFHK
ncbi:hypothetical protein [Glutamicibacter creatinolyticus]|uniref:hypothetical protein n=1 Tax=Glutamicibacter creatinolyticus TaxID=162496 RepID=UPI0037C05DCA